MLPFFTYQVDAFGTGEFDICTGRVEEGVAEEIFSLPAQDAEDDLLRRTPLMGRDHQWQAGDVLYSFLEPEKAAAAGIGLISQHDACPLAAAHGACSAVSEQVYEYVPGSYLEWIEVCIAEYPVALLAGGEMYGLYGLDPEWFNDRSHPKDVLKIKKME
jgi:predicted RecA/RadA family phage recombinase